MHRLDGKAVASGHHPVDVASYLIGVGGGGPADPVVLAILLDYYLFNILCLLSLRIWDGGSADDNLERVGLLLDRLQGPDGSGHRFASHAGTLILIATAHFEVEERGYRSLLEKVTTLDAAHRAKIALDHAGCMGCHLRFGFEATYGRDTVVMRPTTSRLPWLSFALRPSWTNAPRRLTRRRRRPHRRPVARALRASDSAFARRSPRIVRELVERFEAFRPSLGVFTAVFFFNYSTTSSREPSSTRCCAAVDREPQRSADDGRRRRRREDLAGDDVDGPCARSPIESEAVMPVIVYDPVAGGGRSPSRCKLPALHGGR